MNRPISPTLHGVLDYATVATTLLAPRLLAFPEPATRACDLLAGSYLGLSLLTDYPLAAKRAIPFKAHGAAEVGSGLVIPTLPWAFGFADHRAARNFFLGLTAVTAVVAALTDWDAEN
jgi:hypothetical protein